MDFELLHMKYHFVFCYFTFKKRIRGYDGNRLRCRLDKLTSGLKVLLIFISLIVTPLSSDVYNSFAVDHTLIIVVRESCLVVVVFEGLVEIWNTVCVDRHLGSSELRRSERC